MGRYLELSSIEMLQCLLVKTTSVKGNVLVGRKLNLASGGCGVLVGFFVSDHRGQNPVSGETGGSESLLTST